MPPRLESAPKKRVRRKAAPKPRPIGQNAAPAPKVTRPTYEQKIQQGVTAGPSPRESKNYPAQVKKVRVKRAVQQAKQGKPFNPQYLRAAIRTGQAPDVSEGSHGVFFVKNRRKFLPDTQMPVLPKHGDRRKDLTKVFKASETQTLGDSVHAPALKVLEATATPLHAIAGTVAGKGPGYGIKHKTTFGSILRKHKVPGAGALGFAADVALDPTTYVSFGTGSVARKAALDAAKQTSEHYALVAEREAAKASRRGGTEAQIARRADRARADVLREGEAQAKAAARRAEAQHKPGSGLTASLTGREAPGVTKATAAAGRTVKKVSAKTPKAVRKSGSFGRELASELRPTLTPPGVNAETYVAARQGARSSRSFVHQHIAAADARARGLKEQIGEEDYAQVVDALERGRIGKLPDHLHQPAIALRSAYRHANRLRKRAGVSEGTITKRPKVVVPAVKADVETSRQKLNAAIRDLKAHERMHQESLAGLGVARGRAQILSRNVGGMRAEKRAQARTVPDNVYQFAGGGTGVSQAANALQAGARNVTKAREKVSRLQAEHEGVVAAARQQRLAYRRALKQQKSRKGEAVGYHPHAQQKPLLEGLGIVERPEEAPQFSGTLRQPGSSKRRTDKRPVSEQNPQRIEAGQEPYSTDVPLVHINYERGTARAVAAGELEKHLAEVGRELKPRIVERRLKNGKRAYERTYPQNLREGESVFHVGYGGKKSPYMLREVTPKDWAEGNVPKTGKLIALEKKVVDAARQYGRPTQAESAFGRGLDRATRGFKMTATATPGFHVRNLIGDTQLAYLSQPGHKLPLNLYEARKAVSGLNAQRRATEKLVHDTTSDKAIRVAGKNMPVDDFLKLAHKHGIPQSGYLTGELRDLGGTAVQEGVGKKGRIRTATGKAGRVVFQNRAVKALTQDRENLVRLSTFKHGLDSGLKPGEAADVAMGTHIDYADLTEFERRYARRLMPFYTFSARALPFQAKKLVTRPGKFANLEKAREEIGGTDVSGLSDYQQRQVPVLVNGKSVTMGLPVNLLNEIPTSAKPGDYGDEIGQFLAALANPVLKAGPELYANKNFTFRDEIQPPDRPLVSAPDWVSIIPEAYRKKLGIVQGPDHRTGQRVWKWPGKLDYKVRSVMVGPLNQINALSTSGANRIGQGQEAKALAGLTGVRVSPTDKTTQAINRLYQKRATLTEQRAALGQQGFNAKHPNAAYRKVHDQIAGLNRQIYTLSKQRGDKTLPRVGGPRKVRRRSGPLGSGGLGGDGLGRGGLGRGGL